PLSPSARSSSAWAGAARAPGATFWMPPSCWALMAISSPRPTSMPSRRAAEKTTTVCPNRCASATSIPTETHPRRHASTKPIWHAGDQPRYGQRIGDTVLEKQLNNWYHYIWLCGDHICEQHVHNLDVANWIMQGHPVKCWGMGARQQLDGKSGEIWDNFGVEYEYANGVRLHAYCGQIKRAWRSVSEAATGAIGTAEMQDGRNDVKSKEGKAWRQAT